MSYTTKGSLKTSGECLYITSSAFTHTSTHTPTILHHLWTFAYAFLKQHSQVWPFWIFKKILYRLFLSDPLSSAQQKKEKRKKKRETLQHDYNFRYSIFTHKYDTLLFLFFFYKNNLAIKHTKTICHTEREIKEKRRLWWRAGARRLRQPRRMDDESMAEVKGNHQVTSYGKNHQHYFIRTQDGFQREGGQNSAAALVTC